MAEIGIIVPSEDIAGVKSALAEACISSETGASRGFDGADMVSLIVTLTPAIAGFLATLYATRQRAKRYTQFRYKGLEVKGVSEAELTKLAEKALKDIVKKRS
jgi:hypothetical protein